MWRGFWSWTSTSIERVGPQARTTAPSPGRTLVEPNIGS